MFSATDLANFVACPHIMTLERALAERKIRKPFFDDRAATDLLRQLGDEHEKAYLRHLCEDCKYDVVQIPRNPPAEAFARTLKAMRQGAAAIYQATLDPLGKARADFLVRREDRPSDLGFWSYEVVDTKLARSTRVTALMQLCFYSDLLTELQRHAPEFMSVALGGAAGTEKFRFKKYSAYFERVRRDYQAAVETRAETYPEPVEHCGVCDWSPICEQKWREDDHLSLVAGITRVQRKALKDEIDVDTVAALAKLPIPHRPRLDRIGDQSLENIREQARIQVEGREKGRILYELFETIEENKGLAAMPPPSPGDMFLDFEADPFAFDTGLEYLIGVVTQDSDGEVVYKADWALDPVGEKAAFERLIKEITDRLKFDPGMHVYHFAPYEVGAIKRLAGRHATCTDEVDDLLRGGVFVDLYRVVRQGLRASVESYSIKKLEPLYKYTREVPLKDANTALSTLSTVLVTREGQRLTNDLRGVIQGYNRDDCLSTLRLRDWLEKRRKEWEAKFGKDLPRFAVREEEQDRSEKLTEYIVRVRALEERLTQDLPEDPSQQSVEQHATWLLAKSLEWHRREDKATWWEYFRLKELTAEELTEDRSAIGDLVYVGEVGHVDRSIIHRYRFPPQDYRISLGNKSRDPATGKSPGQIIGIDDENLTLDIKRGKTSSVPHPTALIPFELFQTPVQRDSLLRLGDWVAENGIDASGSYRAARDILLRRAPSGEGHAPLLMTNVDEEIGKTAKRLVVELDQSTLPVQGPPGSGKTYHGARMVVELVANGRKVGITGPSHKVISKLLETICEAARGHNVDLAIVQKAGEEGEDACDDSMVRLVRKNEDVLEALNEGTAQIGAGTSWLWAREEMADSVGVLFVDEAGQMSLANVLAISQAASSVVLLGDPQQLDQPQKGVHPDGTGVSALSHLLNGQATIDEKHGLFLKDTWRLHPDICKFTSEQFYEDRLLPEKRNYRQRLNTAGLLDGTGLRFVPVEHSGNRSESEEEVAVVVELIKGPLESQATWTDREGATHPLELKHILIVAPYNAQVSALACALPEACIGTVDKFQGQEAPVVIYSMAASSAEDAPRGMEFLYSLNRLNVAISRARCVAVIVASPALFKVDCKTPRQVESANAFCRFLEMAE